MSLKSLCGTFRDNVIAELTQVGEMRWSLTNSIKNILVLIKVWKQAVGYVVKRAVWKHAVGYVLN